MKDICVDVIIPSYNGMPYLRSTIESVLAQTHSNIKVYVIDDGSPDNGKTQLYINSLTDKRVKYLRKKNGGASSARNYGFKKSKSPMIAFLDADDIWYPEKLEKQLELYELKPTLGLVYGLCDFINESNEPKGKCSYEKRGNLYNYLMKGNRITGSASMVLIPRVVLDRVGLFNEGIIIGEDWEVWLRIAEHYEIDYVPEYIAALRILPSGVQQNNLKMAEGLEHMFKVAEESLRLTVRQRSALAGTCLWDAAYYYMLARKQKEARAALLRCFWLNPPAIFRLYHHRWYFNLRILLGNKLLRKLRYKLSKSYRKQYNEQMKNHE